MNVKDCYVYLVLAIGLLTPRNATDAQACAAPDTLTPDGGATPAGLRGASGLVPSSKPRARPPGDDCIEVCLGRGCLQAGSAGPWGQLF